MKAEIESYKAGVNNTKTIAIGQLNIYTESFLKFTGKKEINAKAVSGARSKLAGFIHKTFVSEKIFSIHSQHQVLLANYMHSDVVNVHKLTYIIQC